MIEQEIRDIVDEMWDKAYAVARDELAQGYRVILDGEFDTYHIRISDSIILRGGGQEYIRMYVENAVRYEETQRNLEGSIIHEDLDVIEDEELKRLATMTDEDELMTLLSIADSNQKDIIYDEIRYRRDQELGIPA